MALEVVNPGQSVKVRQADGTFKTETIPPNMWGVKDENDILVDNMVYDSIGKAQAVVKGMRT